MDSDFSLAARRFNLATHVSTSFEPGAKIKICPLSKENLSCIEKAKSAACVYKLLLGSILSLSISWERYRYSIGKAFRSITYSAGIGSIFVGIGVALAITNLGTFAPKL